MIDAVTLGVDCARWPRVGPSTSARWSSAPCGQAATPTPRSDSFDTAVQGAAAVASIQAVSASSLAPGVTARLLETEAGVRLLAKLGRRLPEAVQALCSLRADAARMVGAGVTIARS